LFLMISHQSKMLSTNLQWEKRDVWTLSITTSPCCWIWWLYVLTWTLIVFSNVCGFCPSTIFHRIFHLATSSRNACLSPISVRKKSKIEMLVSSASSKRSFSAMRRLKDCLRATMGDEKSSKTIFFLPLTFHPKF
jgi:hypothetical protein